MIAKPFLFGLIASLIGFGLVIEACARSNDEITPAQLSKISADQGQETVTSASIDGKGATDVMHGDNISAELRTVPQSMEQIRLSFAPVVNDVAPAVVNIFTRRSVQPRNVDPIFERFFGLQSPREQTSLGSGVIVSPDGVVITNNHVIENMTEIKVVLNDRREYEAELIFTDAQTDLAVLRVESDEPFPFMQFANSDAAEVGDVVLAIGNPFGVGQTVTSGIVSALARTAVSISDYQFFIQTDAAINPGNSGGALVDVNGRLIGINTAIYSRSGGSNGIGFAIPSRLVQQVLYSAVNGGELARPWLGASTGTVTPEISSALGLDRPAGAIIEEIWPDGPAAKAGLKPGDVVTQIGGKPVFDAETLRYRIGVGSDGDVADIKFVREGKDKIIKVSLDLPPQTPLADERSLEGNHPLRGVVVANLSPRFNEEINIDPFLTGVVVKELSARSFAGRRGVRRNYRILSVNDKPIFTTLQLERELEKTVTRWVIEIDTGTRIIPWRVGR